jgi:P-type Cu+ transporter
MSPHEEDPAGATTLVTDPVCGEKLDPKTAAATREHDGTTFYFTSLDCADTFDADPHRYGHPHATH